MPLNQNIHICFASPGSIEFISIDEINYVAAFGGQSVVVLNSGHSILVDRNMDQMTERLERYGFRRLQEGLLQVKKDKQIGNNPKYLEKMYNYLLIYIKYIKAIK